MKFKKIWVKSQFYSEYMKMEFNWDDTGWLRIF